MWDFLSQPDKAIPFFVALIALLTALYKAYKSIRTSIRGLYVLIHDIKKEVRPNGGGSFRDIATRIEAKVETMDTDQKRIIAAVERLQGETAADFAMDEKARWEATPDGAINRVNASMRAIVGRDDWEMTGANWKNCVHREDAPGLAAAWSEAVKDGRFYRAEFRVITRDNQTRTVRSIGQPMRNSAGEVLGWQGYIQELKD